MNHRTKNRPFFLNLTQDVIFKNYFKLDKDLLKSLLQAFLPLPDNSSIKEVIILDSLLPSLTLEEKSSLMDLRVQLDSAEFVNVEMQAFPHKSFTQRILLYWAKNYGSQLKIGEDYKILCPAYSLIFSVYDLFPETESFYTSFSICSDRSPHFCFNEDLRLVTVELSKFKKRTPAALLDLREEWCYLLKELSREEGLQLVEEAKEKGRRDQAARLDDSFNHGMEKGIQRGRREGKAEGMEQGKTELVMNMLENKLDISLISKITGFSEKEICKLKNKS